MSETFQSPHILDATRDNFESEVIERSHQGLVVVDFWAEWCQPCRILGPILEKLAVEYDGKFLLVKANTESLSEIAASLDVRSIPAVFALKGGQVVDSFVGALPEAAIRQWLDRNMPTEAEILRIEAGKLESAEPELAERKYREVLALAPGDVLARIGLGRTVLALRRTDEAREIVEALERRGFLEPEAETLKAELTLRRDPDSVDSLTTLRETHASNPLDRNAQLKLADVLASVGQYEEALGLALDLVERDRRATGESARKLMLAVFQLLGPDSELANDFRRKLSVAL